MSSKQLFNLKLYPPVFVGGGVYNTKERERGLSEMADTPVNMMHLRCGAVHADARCSRTEDDPNRNERLNTGRFTFCHSRRIGKHDKSVISPYVLYKISRLLYELWRKSHGPLTRRNWSEI